MADQSLSVHLSLFSGLPSSDLDKKEMAGYAQEEGEGRLSKVQGMLATLGSSEW